MAEHRALAESAAREALDMDDDGDYDDGVDLQTYTDAIEAYYHASPLDELPEWARYCSAKQRLAAMVKWHTALRRRLAVLVYLPAPAAAVSDAAPAVARIVATRTPPPAPPPWTTGC
jgi:hypothetical protein